MTQRFTIDGSDALEARLAELSRLAAEGVLKIVPSRRVAALLLAGGYGRGEGGVLRSAAGDEPYNDLEFYILIGGSDRLAERRSGDLLHELSEELSELAGIDVEFKLLSLAKLQRSSVTMFYYDLVSGYRLLAGSDNWVNHCEHHRAAHRIPLHEATRLLLNRCSGLFFTEQRLGQPVFTRDDADFAGRNIAKAKLALGDVLLTMRGQYHWSCRERHKRLRKLAAEDPSLMPLTLLHEQGVEFKLHPSRSERGAQELRIELEFIKDIARESWLQLESRRLGQRFMSVRDYAIDPHSKCPETRPLKNRLINARTFGPAAVRDPRYPRERLLRSLPVLLWEPCSRDLLIGAQSELGWSGAESHGLVSAYESIWKNFN